jgi:alcohol dehydrogenase (cytochrome c)
VLALKTSDGSTLWHASIGGVGNSPVTIEIDGKQHLLVSGGSVLYAWRLPQ